MDEVWSRQGPTLTCRTCEAPNDGATGKGTPKDGVVYICVYCSTISILCSQGTDLRIPTDEELKSILADKGAQRALKGIKEMNLTPPQLRKEKP